MTLRQPADIAVENVVTGGGPGLRSGGNGDFSGGCGIGGRET
jgi:hypothetical protein